LTEINWASWRKSSYSGAGDCLELLVCTNGVCLRDSKRPDGAVLRFTGPQWAAFLARVKAGEPGARLPRGR
jgi:hypothetical protein